jgi:hypothetical protein
MRSFHFRGWFVGQVLCLSLVSGFLLATSAHAQYRNNAIQLPSVGYMAMGMADWPMGYIITTLGLGDDTDWKWNAWDNLTIGTGYSRALGYNLWLEVQAAVGFSNATYPPSGFFHPLVALNTSTGLRYNLFDEEYRPFVAGHIHYLWLYNTVDPDGVEDLHIQTNELFGGQSMWVGLRSGAGFEWFFMSSLRGWGVDIPLFYDEMSVQFEVDSLFFLSLSDRPILPSGTARFSYNVYF